MEEFIDAVNTALGIGVERLNWWQMSARAVLVFVTALIIIRVGNKRIFGKNTAFDIVLGIIFGSILSRAITGNSPLWPTLCAALVLVLLHRFLAFLSYSTSGLFGNFIKGTSTMLIKNGKLLEDEIKRLNLTENDLKEAMRQGGVTSIDQIEYACLERSGEISIIKKT